MAVKLELYRVFKEVAETGNISTAAKNLYISQSAVSQSIKQLETALQARLFSRSPGASALPGRGRCSISTSAVLWDCWPPERTNASQAQQLLLGTLVIGASDTVTSFFLTHYLDAFHRLHPWHPAENRQWTQRQGLEHAQVRRRGHRLASSPSDSAISNWPCFSTHSVFVAGSSYECDFDHVYTRQEIAAFPSSCWSARPAAGYFWSSIFSKAASR